MQQGSNSKAVKPLTAKERAEMYRLGRKVHHLKASRPEQSRYLELSRADEAASASLAKAGA